MIFFRKTAVCSAALAVFLSGNFVYPEPATARDNREEVIAGLSEKSN